MHNSFPQIYLLPISAKFNKHLKRLGRSSIAPNMLVELEDVFIEVIEVSQEAFFSSSYSKEKFIDLLAVQL